MQQRFYQRSKFLQPSNFHDQFHHYCIWHASSLFVWLSWKKAKSNYNSFSLLIPTEDIAYSILMLWLLLCLCRLCTVVLLCFHYIPFVPLSWANMDASATVEASYDCTVFRSVPFKHYCWVDQQSFEGCPCSFEGVLHKWRHEHLRRFSM